MHRADVLVIGPLEPLLLRPVRVRLGLAVAGAVGLLCAGLLAALIWALYIGLLPASLSEPLGAVVSGWAPAHDNATVPVQVSSFPAGAAIFLGNRELGFTPATVTVSRRDLLVLRRGGFLDAFVRVGGPSIEVPLWRARPESRLVRPPGTGAVIRSADFLPDGRVALAVEVPPTGERQPWAYDPVGARLDRLGYGAAPGALPSAVAIAPDGTQTAAILRLDGLDGAAADHVSGATRGLRTRATPPRAGAPPCADAAGSAASLAGGLPPARKLGRSRWAVEPTFAGMNRFRRFDDPL